MPYKKILFNYFNLIEKTPAVILLVFFIYRLVHFKKKIRSRFFNIQGGTSGSWILGSCGSFWILLDPMDSFGSYGFFWILWILLDPMDPFGSYGSFWILWILLDPMDPSGSYRSFWILSDPMDPLGSSWILMDPARS